MAGRSPYAAEFRAIEQSRKIYEQEKTLELYLNARNALAGFFDQCSPSGEAQDSGDQLSAIPSARLNELITTFEDALLVMVGAKSRKRLRSRASGAASRYVQRYGDIDSICRAELTLRKLAVLCLKNISRLYRGKFRLPEWDRRISEAEEEFDAAVEAWWQLTWELS